MPANLVNNIFPLDFIKNDLTFDLTGSPYVSKGKKSISKYKITALPAVGQKFYIEFEGKSLEFTVKNPSSISANDAYAIQNYTGALLINELTSKIIFNYYLSIFYDITITSDLIITFTAKEPGTGNVTLKDISIDNTGIVTTTIGSSSVLKNNYQIFAKLIISRYFNENIETLETQPIFLSLNDKNLVSFPAEILRSYFENIDIPLADSTFSASILKYAYLKVQIQFAEYYDHTVQLVKSSSNYYLLNAASLDNFRNVNQGDWIDPIDSSMISQSSYARAFGSDSGLCIRTFINCPQYAYFFYFNKDISANQQKTLNVKVQGLLRDGSIVIKNITFNVKNYNFVRVPLSVKALGLSEETSLIEYSVQIFAVADTSKTWTRKFVITPEPFNAKVFLFQNRYGVLESFFTESESFEKNISGDVMTKGNFVDIDREIEKTFICKTGPKSIREMQLLSDALDSNFNFIWINKRAVSVVILPESFVIKNESEDFQEAEFKYRINLPEVNRDLYISRIKEVISIEGIPESDTVINEENLILNSNRTNNLI
jgi:hypothetical protein